ncbi:hypothetical protein HDU96_006712 [Phlyctochytrium bullatum]|nr:hypothetical protein HDU96_006712 [Phlyctochytrium bullatum]
MAQSRRVFPTLSVLVLHTVLMLEMVKGKTRRRAILMQVWAHPESELKVGITSISDPATFTTNETITVDGAAVVVGVGETATPLTASVLNTAARVALLAVVEFVVTSDVVEFVATKAVVVSEDRYMQR